MGPGMLSGIYRPEEIRFNVKKMSEDRGAAFVEDKVVKILAGERRLQLQSGMEISYDVISFNTGSIVPIADQMLANESIIAVKPIENLLKARRKIIEALKNRELKITVAGGGPTGVEIAGNLDRLVKTESGRCQITLVAGERLLSQFKESIRRHALTSLTRRNVQVTEGAKVVHIKDNMVELSSGDVLKSDFVFMAVGVKPSPLFENSGLPTSKDGGLRVNQYLQSVAYPEIFGGGDCITFEPQPLPKVGVYAVRQNPLLLHNLMKALNAAPLQSFFPQRSYLLAFNMGDGNAIVHWHSFGLSGKLGFALKNYIDQKFMKNFQVSGEVN
jgi:NADH dehydrogenase FAD-containing subunit